MLYERQALLLIKTSPGRLHLKDVTWNPLLNSEVTRKYEFLMVATSLYQLWSVENWVLAPSSFISCM